MEVEAEPVCKEIAQHRHLLVARGPNLAGGDGNNVIVIGFYPCRSAENGSRIEIIGCCDEQLEGVVLLNKTTAALHDDVAAGLGIGSHRLDGRDFKGVELWSRCRLGDRSRPRAYCGNLRKNSDGGKKQGCTYKLADHTVVPPRENVRQAILSLTGKNRRYSPFPITCSLPIRSRRGRPETGAG